MTKFGADWVKPGNMVSNGAFTLAEFTPNDKVKIVKNPKFYDAASVKLDVVNYLTAEDRSAAMKRFEAGELDSNNDFPTEQLAELKAKLGDQVRISPLLGTYYYIFKTKKEPWSNPKLRHAISKAIDRDYLAEKVWQNAMFPAYSMVPPGVAGYTTSTTDYAVAAQLDREDEAKKLFEELGITPEKPVKMELRFNTSDNHKNTAVAIQDMLKPFGFEVTLLNTDGKTHYSYLEQKGDFDVARAGWNADYKDPATFLDLGKTGAGNNYGEYSNKDYDDLLERRRQRGRPGQAHGAALKRRGDPDARSAGDAPALLQQSLYCLEQDQGLRRQCDGYPPEPLHQQGIGDTGRSAKLRPAILAGAMHAEICAQAAADGYSDAVFDRHHELFPDAPRAGRAVQSGKGPDARYQGQSGTRLSSG